MYRSKGPPGVRSGKWHEWAGKHPSQWLETAWRLLRIHLQPVRHQQLVAAMAGPSTRDILRLQPRIVYRYSTEYLFRGNDWHSRRLMLQHHYQHLNRWHDALFCSQVFRHGCELWCAVIDDHRLDIRLHGPCVTSRHREGELTLAFRMDDTTLFRLAFSVCPAAALPPAAEGHGASVLYIGQVQGVSGRFELIRQATRLCHDVAPADTLMHALSGLADSWNIDRALGVSQRLQLTHGHKVAGEGFDYDGFWMRHAEPQGASDHALIHFPLKEKPIEDVAAKHRGRTLRKRAFKQSVALAVGRSMRSVVCSEMRAQAGQDDNRGSAVVSSVRRMA